MPPTQSRWRGKSADPLVQHRAMVVQYLGGDALPIEQRLALSTRIRNFCRDHELRSEQGVASRRLLNDLLRVGAIVEFDEELAAFAAEARTTSAPFDLYWSAVFTATRQLMRSTGSDSEGLVHAAATIGRQLQIGDAPGVHLLQTFTLRYQQRRVRETTNGLETPSPHAPPITAGTALLALALAESGRLESARALLDRVVVRGTIRLPRDNFWFGGACLFAGVAAVCGSAEQRRVLRDALEHDGSTFCLFGLGSAVFGTRHHWLARLAVGDGDLVAARSHLAAASRICHDGDAPFWAARAQQESRSLGTSLAPER